MAKITKEFYNSYRANRIVQDAQEPDSKKNWNLRNPSLFSNSGKKVFTTDLPHWDIPVCSGPDFVSQDRKIDFNDPEPVKSVRPDKSIKFIRFRDRKTNTGSG